MDYWESGMHLALGTDLFDSFMRYQRRLLSEYQRLAEEFGFITVDARLPIDQVQEALRAQISELLHKGETRHVPADSVNPPAPFRDED